jgi:Sigma-70, region 4
MQEKRVDNRWGEHGSSLLPRSLRNAWADEPLPQWIAAELKLSSGSTSAALGPSVWTSEDVKALTSRQRNFLLNLVQVRRSEIQAIKVFAQPVPYWLDLKDLAFSTRTRNCLVTGNLLGESERLSGLTFGDLFKIRSMGVVSVLEFACLVETAVEKSTAGRPEVEPTPTDDELLEIISEPWADQVGPADPRFSDLFPPLPHATLLEMIDALTGGPDTDATALSQLSETMPELRKRVEQITALPLETQLREFLRALSRFEGERLSAFVARFGWGGKPPITLEEAGERLNITRERVRQLQEKVSARLAAISFPTFMPALDEAVRALAEASPLSADSAGALLKQRRISGIDFHPESVIAAAAACGRNPPIQLQTIKKKTIVAAAAIQDADVILRVAYRQAHASGASNVGEVVAEMTADKITVGEDAVRHVLREFSEAHFVEVDWFFHRPPNPERDRLRNVTRKMLSVASPIELGAIREGLRRVYRYRGHRGVKTWSLLVPPKSVLRAYYHAHPEFIIDESEMVKPIEPLDYRGELALNDTILVDVLRSSPACVLDRASLATECTRRSMNVNTFSLYLTYSPVILHLGTDVWSLRGVRVDPAAVEAIREANAHRQKERRVLDHGWAPEGQLWLAARIRAAHDAAGLVVSMPGAIRHYVSGRQFDARDEDGVSHGSIRVNNEGASYGFGRFLRQRGADEGDILIAEFDLTKNVALLRLGDDELLEQLSPEG